MFGNAKLVIALGIAGGITYTVHRQQKLDTERMRAGLEEDRLRVNAKLRARKRAAKQQQQEQQQQQQEQQQQEEQKEGEDYSHCTLAEPLDNNCPPIEESHRLTAQSLPNNIDSPPPPRTSTSTTATATQRRR